MRPSSMVPRKSTFVEQAIWHFKSQILGSYDQNFAREDHLLTPAFFSIYLKDLKGILSQPSGLLLGSSFGITMVIFVMSTQIHLSILRHIFAQNRPRKYEDRRVSCNHANGRDMVLLMIHLKFQNNPIGSARDTVLLLSAPKCTMTASSNVWNDNLCRTAGAAAWAA